MPAGDYVYLKDASGNLATVSANGSLNVQSSTVSGSVTAIIGTQTVGRTRAVLTPSDLSGGISLGSGDTITMVVKNFSSSSGDVYLGYSNEPPYSGFGYNIAPGEAFSIDLDNFNKVAVMGTVSGFCKVAYTGLA